MLNVGLQIWHLLLMTVSLIVCVFFVKKLINFFARSLLNFYSSLESVRIYIYLFTTSSCFHTYIFMLFWAVVIQVI